MKFTAAKELVANQHAFPKNRRSVGVQFLRTLVDVLKPIEEPRPHRGKPLEISHAFNQREMRYDVRQWTGGVKPTKMAGILDILLDPPAMG